MGFICTICVPYCARYSRITYITIKFWNTVIFPGVKQQSSQNSCAGLTRYLEWKTAKCHCRCWMVSHRSGWGRYTGIHRSTTLGNMNFMSATNIYFQHKNHTNTQWSLCESLGLRSSINPTHEKVSKTATWLAGRCSSLGRRDFFCQLPSSGFISKYLHRKHFSSSSIGKYYS